MVLENEGSRVLQDSHFYFRAMDTKFIKALKEVLREQLVKKHSVDIEGLGLFEVKHYEQHQKRFSNGKVVMMPPADVLEFKSNITVSDEN